MTLDQSKSVAAHLHLNPCKHGHAAAQARHAVSSYSNPELKLQQDAYQAEMNLFYLRNTLCQRFDGESRTVPPGAETSSVPVSERYLAQGQEWTGE